MNIKTSIFFISIGLIGPSLFGMETPENYEKRCKGFLYLANQFFRQRNPQMEQLRQVQLIDYPAQRKTVALINRGTILLTTIIGHDPYSADIVTACCGSSSVMRSLSSVERYSLTQAYSNSYQLMYPNQNSDALIGREFICER